jgi:hypothetical protein
MLPAPQNLQAVAGVAGRVRGHKDSFDGVILDQFLQRRIRLGTPTRSRKVGTLRRNQIAHRHDLHVRMILKPECGAKPADSMPNDPHAEPPVGN